MAKIDFLLVVLLIPYNDVFCSLPKNEHSTLKPNLLKSYRTKFNVTVPKFYNNRHPSRPNLPVVNKHVKDKPDHKAVNNTDHKIPYSEHEKPRNVSTRPKYTTNGQLVFPKKKEEILEFVPTKLYAQVRGKHTVKRLPKKYAVEEAATDEEKENAARLREVVTNKKTNTVYTEEGYEDSAYDHAGHIRDADFEEQFGRKLKNKYDEKGETNHPKKERLGNSGEDVAPAESTGRAKVKEDVGETIGRVKVNKDLNPKRVVIKGIRNLENDVVREIEKTEKDADEYHARISQIKASEENDDDSEGEDEDDEDDDTEDDEDEDESGEEGEVEESEDVSEDNESKSSNTRNVSGSGSLEESGSKTVEISQEDSSTRKYSEFTARDRNREDESTSDNSGSSRSTEDGDSRTVEVDHGPRKVYPTSAPIKDGDFRGTVKFQSNEQSREVSGSAENVRANEYGTDAAPAGSGESRFTSTITHKLPEHTTPATSQFNFGDVLWKGFKERQKLRGLSDPNRKKTLEQKPKLNALVSANDVKPYYDHVVTTSFNFEPITPKPISYSSLENNNILNTYQSDNSFVNFINPLDVGQIETVTLLPPKSEPLISFEPVTPAKLFEFKEESTTLEYPTTFLDTSFVEQTTTEKTTGYDHNPYLSPFAQQFDGKLKRYKPIPRDKPIAIKIEDELQPPKYSKKPTNTNNLDSFSDLDKYTLTSTSKPYKQNSYTPRPATYRQKIVPSENELTILKPPKFVQLQVIPKASSYRRPLFGGAGSYDPILNNYILPRIVQGQFNPPLDLYPPALGVKSTYTLYNTPTARTSQIQPTQIQQYRILKPKIIRYKRSLNPTDVIVLNQILNGNNSINNFKNNDRNINIKVPTKHNKHIDLLGKSSKIPESVVDKEIKIRFPEKNTTNENVTQTHENGEGIVEVEVPEFDDFVDDKGEYEKNDYPDVEEEQLDREKYPYYDSDLGKQDSTLKYILNPNYVPKKTLGGMEFYDSRILECSEIEPDLNNVTPNAEEEPTTTLGYNEDLPRLKGLGDKLDCFKAKYFDPNPLDNPLFMEKRIDHLEIPQEIDPQAFSKKISDWSEERDEYIHPKLSKTPEYGSKKDLKVETSKKRHRYHYPVPYKYRIRKKSRPIRRKRRRRPSNHTLVPLRLYGNQVYDDVMGTIKKSKKPKRSRKRKRHHRQHADYSEPEKQTVKPSEESSEEIDAVKLRFVSENSRNPSRLQADSSDSSIPVIDIPSTNLPSNVRILDGGPYDSIHIRKPKGSKLKINYRVAPPSRNYHKKETFENSYRDHRIHKRSVVNPSEDGSVAINSHQLTGDPTITEEAQVSTPRVIYTVPTRPKNAKPENDTGRHGQFTTEPNLSRTVDSRRQEAVYNPIEDQNEEHSVTSKAPLRVIVKDPLRIVVKDQVKKKPIPSVFSTPTETIIRINHDVHYRTQRPLEDGQSTSKPKVYQEIERDEKNGSRIVSDEDIPKKIGKRYEVHEVPNEEKMKPKPDPKPASKPSSKPASKPSSKSVSKPAAKDYSAEDNEEMTDYSDDKSDNEETRTSENSEGSNEEESSNQESSNQESSNQESSNQESSKQESSKQQSVEERSDERPSNIRSNDSEEDANSGGEEEESEEEGGEEDSKEHFSRFTFRPYSPPERYEDPDFAHLGPRINKPAFYHPTFKTPEYEFYKFGKHVGHVSDESYGSVESEEKMRYVFPWHQHDSDESKQYAHSIKRYEFPWEKRERLARERKNRYRYSDEGSEEDSSEGETEDTASSEHQLSYSKPWNIKVYKNPLPKRSKSDAAYDSEHETSNIKPTVTQTKLRPNVTVSKVNRTIIQIIKNPILPLNLDVEVSTELPVKVTTPTVIPRITTTTTTTTTTMKPAATNPIVADISRKSFEILKTNPKARRTPKIHVTTTSTTSSPITRRRTNFRTNPSVTTEASSTTHRYSRRGRRIVRTSTVSPRHV